LQLDNCDTIATVLDKRGGVCVKTSWVILANDAQFQWAAKKNRVFDQQFYHGNSALMFVKAWRQCKDFASSVTGY